MKKANEYVKGQIRNDFCLNVKFSQYISFSSYVKSAYWTGEECSRRPSWTLPFMGQCEFGHFPWDVGFLYL